jgi:hypothetical protein
VVFFAGHRQRLFPRHGEFDGSVNDSITPSFIDCIFIIAVSPVFAAGPSEHVRAIVSGS